MLKRFFERIPKRVRDGSIMALALIAATITAGAWPLRIGLSICFGIAIFEIVLSLLSLLLQDRAVKAIRFRSSMAIVAQISILGLLACYVTAKPIAAGEVFAAAVVAFVADIGGWAFGKKWGKHKPQLLSRLSPNKTIEGYIGGLVASWVIGGLFIYFLRPSAPLLAQVVLWLAGGTIACLGDLLGSAVKRGLKLNDSGEIAAQLPVFKWLERFVGSHGGYLDRLDSLGLTLALYYFLLFITGAL